jgi:hypothetical protein
MELNIYCIPLHLIPLQFIPLRSILLHFIDPNRALNTFNTSFTLLPSLAWTWTSHYSLERELESSSIHTDDTVEWHTNKNRSGQRKCLLLFSCSSFNSYFNLTTFHFLKNFFFFSMEEVQESQPQSTLGNLICIFL